MTTDVREEVRAWIGEHWDVDLPLREWRERLLESGWAAPSWPTEGFGWGLSPTADAIVAEELARAGAVGPPLGAGVGLAAGFDDEHLIGGEGFDRPPLGVLRAAELALQVLAHRHVPEGVRVAQHALM